MHKKLLISFYIFLGLALLSGGAAVGVALARSQGNAAQATAASTDLRTAFTYQGKLESDGVAVYDTCDFQFRLYDAESGGNPVGITVTHTSVAVTQGLFSVQLDFGNGPFNGDDRYLETAVRCSGDPTYTTLTTRQPLTPAPYDLYQQRQLNYLTVPGYLSGLVGQVAVKDCIEMDMELECSDKTALTVAVHEGGEVHIEGAYTYAVEGNCDDPPCPGDGIFTDTLVITMQKGTLPSAQTSKDFEVTITVTNVDTGASVTFSLSPDYPLYDGYNNGAPIDVRATLLTDSLVQLVVNLTDIKYILTESAAELAATGTYQAGANQAEMAVQIDNAGQLRTNYLASVLNCTLPVDPVIVQAATLDAGESRELVFTLNGHRAFTTADSCRVYLRSPTGRLYANQIITFVEASP
jgi:hypothetical protein